MPAKIFFLLLCAVFFAGAFKTNDSDLETIVQKLDDWSKKHPQEKVYLHLNKSLFLTGDTLYCKAYVVNAGINTPSSISRIVYVDLINNSGTVEKSLVVPLSDGIGWCAIPVSNVLKGGNYHVRAYTNWMKNLDDFFFNKSVTILDGSDKKISSVKTQANHKMYFFPEGGQMVAGLPARIGFKAIGANGLGVAVSGDILDESGNKVINFQSGFAGMGSCVFTPLPKHTYSAAVNYNDGFEDKIVLPKAETSGYALTIDNLNKENISINVMAKDAPDDVFLIAQSGNEVRYSAKLTLQNGAVGVKVSNKKFPTGIVQFTLFGNGLPVAERLVFVNHNNLLNMATSLEKQTSNKRAKMKLTLHVTDNLDEPVTGSFSVAVTDATTAPYDKTKEENITTNLLLTSDLKGFVENPAYYFANGDSSRIRALDNLLLTQGWRRFQWKEVLAEQTLSPRYVAEKSLSLTGKVISEKGQPFADATVSLLSKNSNGFLLQTQTDSGGNFRFENLAATGDAQFALQAATKDGSKNAVITVNNFFLPEVKNNQTINPVTAGDSSFGFYTLANAKRYEEKKKYGLISNDVNTLQDVTVTTTKLTKIQQAVAPSYNLNGAGNADQILTYDDLFNCHNLSQCLPGKMIGVRFKTIIDPVTKATLRTVAYSASGQGSPMLLIVDGVDIPADQSSVDNIPASDIQSIEVLRSGAYLSTYGTRAAGGVLIFTTKKGNLDYNHLDDKKTTDKNMLFTTVHGYAIRREFYSPDYSIASNNSAVPDLRSTIYWQPNVVTDDEGNATIEWYNADVTGKYNIVIEGISNDGRMGNTSINYTVK